MMVGKASQNLQKTLHTPFSRRFIQLTLADSVKSPGIILDTTLLLENKLIKLQEALFSNSVWTAK